MTSNAGRCVLALPIPLAKTPISSNQKRDFQELERRVFQELEQRFTVLAVLADNEQLLADEFKIAQRLMCGLSCKTMFSNELWTSIWPL